MKIHRDRTAVFISRRRSVQGKQIDKKFLPIHRNWSSAHCWNNGWRHRPTETNLSWFVSCFLWLRQKLFLSGQTPKTMRP